MNVYERRSLGSSLTFIRVQYHLCPPCLCGEMCVVRCEIDSHLLLHPPTIAGLISRSTPDKVLSSHQQLCA